MDDSIIRLLGFTPKQQEAFDEALERETNRIHAQHEEELFRKENKEEL